MTSTPYGGAKSEPTAPPRSRESQKSFLTAWLLSLLLGPFGADRFYLGKIGTATLKLVTLGGLGIWYLVDLVLILTAQMTDKQGRTLEGYDNNKKMAWVVSAIFIVLMLVLSTANKGSSKNEAIEIKVSETAQSAVEENIVAGERDEEPAEKPVEEVVEEKPIPTNDEVIAAFRDYLDERADSGVLMAKSVSDISFEDGVVTVTFDPTLTGIPDPDLVITTAPFDNWAKFVGMPIAFMDEEGKFLRRAVNSVETLHIDGSSLGTMSTAEIYEDSTMEKYTPGD